VNPVYCVSLFFIVLPDQRRREDRIGLDRRGEERRGEVDNTQILSSFLL
jgi:hypothetical protein